MAAADLAALAIDTHGNFIFGTAELRAGLNALARIGGGALGAATVLGVQHTKSAVEFGTFDQTAVQFSHAYGAATNRHGTFFVTAFNLRAVDIASSFRYANRAAVELRAHVNFFRTTL